MMRSEFRSDIIAKLLDYGQWPAVETILHMLSLADIGRFMLVCRYLMNNKIHC
jgi:hypothetical protein